MEYLDFAGRKRGRSLELIFPGWSGGETVAFYSPHDDDVVLGAGYLLRAVLESGGRPAVLIFCRGDAGYSRLEDKAGIVAVRKKEAVAAYRRLGVDEADIVFFDYPDFGLMPAVGRGDADSGELFDALVAFLRQRRVSRIVFVSGHREHWDHTAVFYQGIYTSPQAGDPILADLGRPYPARTYLAYSVWADFEPGARKGLLRADKGILAAESDEDMVRAALKAFASQGLIMDKTIAARRDRRRAGKKYLELYQTVNLRAPIDYAPYFKALKKFIRKP